MIVSVGAKWKTFQCHDMFHHQTINIRITNKNDKFASDPCYFVFLSVHHESDLCGWRNLSITIFLSFIFVSENLTNGKSLDDAGPDVKNAFNV